MTTLSTRTGAPFAQATAAAPSHDALVQALAALAHRIEAGDATAEADLSALLATIEAHDDPRCVGLYVFGAGMARRLQGRTIERANLYLSRFEVPQIHLFNLLGRAVPFVGLATRIANDAIMQAIAGRSRPTVIDVGIGTGRQMGLLLESLAAAGRLPRLLTVIGIEPSAWALDEARAHLEATAARLGAEVSFYGIASTAEALTDADWRRIRQACTSRPVVNASFALHHIADDAQGRDQRDAVLKRLHALSPDTLVLAEPDSDHLERGYARRFANCLAHFGAVFRTLDRLPLDQADRNALKVGFFGREIADILGSPEHERSERHEHAASWLARLQAAGFDVARRGELPAATAGVGITRRAQHVSLDEGDVPVVAIFTATTAPAVSVHRAPSAEALAL